MRSWYRNATGFSLLEAVLTIVFMGVSFLGLAYLFGNVTQQALKADLSVLATKLAREKLEEIVQLKADSGYAAVGNQGPETVSSGAWSFTRQVAVQYVNPADFSATAVNTGYKQVEVAVSWGSGAGSSVTLTTLVTDMVPSQVTGTGYAPCP